VAWTQVKKTNSNWTQERKGSWFKIGWFRDWFGWGKPTQVKKTSSSWTQERKG